MSFVYCVRISDEFWVLLQLMYRIFGSPCALSLDSPLHSTIVTLLDVRNAHVRNYTSKKYRKPYSFCLFLVLITSKKYSKRQKDTIHFFLVICYTSSLPQRPIFQENHNVSYFFQASDRANPKETRNNRPQPFPSDAHEASRRGRSGRRKRRGRCREAPCNGGCS